MKHSLSLPVVLGLLLTAGCGRGGTLAATGEDVRPTEDASFQPAEILRNMPMNSDFRCLGIALVAEALKALHRRCADVRFLGSWPTGSVAGAVPPQLDEASRWLTRLREGKR